MDDHKIPCFDFSRPARDIFDVLGFKFLVNPHLPAGVVEFWQDGKCVGYINNLQATCGSGSSYYLDIEKLT